MNIRSFLPVFLAAVLLLVPSASVFAMGDKGLEGLVDVQILADSLDLKTFSGQKKTPGTEALVREHLIQAGWVPNSEGTFIVRMNGRMLGYSTNAKLHSLYIMPVTRPVIHTRKPLPAATGHYVVVDEDLSMNNFAAKMSGFGFIGRGSHTKGERFGILPFNKGFVRLLSGGDLSTYILTLDKVDTEKAKQERKDYELYLKCRFSRSTHDYIRRQDNIKKSSAESTNSRQITEYLLCVDVLGAVLYNTRTSSIVREWRIG